MADWKTRLAVSYVDEDKQKVDVTPITSFTPTFSLNAEALHSLEATHIGVIFSPQAMSFSMTVPAIGDAAGEVTAPALKGQGLDLPLPEADGSHWAFQAGG